MANPFSLRTNLPEVIFSIFALRLIIMGAGIGEALALISFVGVYGYFKFMDSKSMNQYDELKDEMNKLKTAVQSVKLGTHLMKSKSSVTTQANEQEKEKPTRYF